MRCETPPLAEQSHVMTSPPPPPLLGNKQEGLSSHCVELDTIPSFLPCSLSIFPQEIYEKYSPEAKNASNGLNMPPTKFTQMPCKFLSETELHSTSMSRQARDLKDLLQTLGHFKFDSSGKPQLPLPRNHKLRSQSHHSSSKITSHTHS